MRANLRTRLLACAVMIMMAGGFRALAVDEVEPDNDDSSGAVTFTAGVDVLDGDFNSSPASVDYWSFTASAGSTYHFHAYELGCNTIINGAHPDLAMDLEASGGGVLATSDVSGDCTGSFNGAEDITWTAPSTGIYYIVIYEATGSTSLSQSYQVTSTEAMPEPLRATRTPSLVAVTVTPTWPSTSSADCSNSGRAPSSSTSPPVMATAMA